MFLTIISSSLPDTGGVYACVGTNFVADGVEKTDVKSVSVSVSDEEPSCGVDECTNFFEFLKIPFSKLVSSSETETSHTKAAA